MNKLVSYGLWKEIKRLAKNSKVKMAAVAYVTSENIKFGQGDLLIVDASRQSIQAGQTSAVLLSNALDRGAELYSCPGLHAKVMLFDGVAVIGSANISQSSEHSLVEAALITDHPGATSTARDFLTQLQASAMRIDGKFLKKINSIEVKKHNYGQFMAQKQTGVTVKLKTPRTWIVSVTWMDEDRFESEIPFIEVGGEKAEQLLHKSSSEVNWMRFTGGHSLFEREAKSGDTVIKIWRETAKQKTPSGVYYHTPILLRQDEPTCMRVFIEEPANLEKTALTWKQFTKLVKQIGLPYKIGRGSIRQIPDDYSDALANLWKQAMKY